MGLRRPRTDTKKASQAWAQAPVIAEPRKQGKVDLGAHWPASLTQSASPRDTISKMKVRGSDALLLRGHCTWCMNIHSDPHTYNMKKLIFKRVKAVNFVSLLEATAKVMWLSLFTHKRLGLLRTACTAMLWFSRHRPVLLRMRGGHATS